MWYTDIIVFVRSGIYCTFDVLQMTSSEFHQGEARKIDSIQYRQIMSGIELHS